MKFGATEKHLKTYDVYTASKHHSGSLVLTDRRLVRIVRNRYGEAHTEIRVADISSVDAGYQTFKHSPVGLFLMIFGAILAIAGLIVWNQLASTVDIPGFISILPGAFLFIIGLALFLTKKMSVYLTITTDERVGQVLDTYVSNASGVKKRLGKKKKKKQVQVKIDERVAMDVVNELSAIVWELQARAKDSSAQVMGGSVGDASDYLAADENPLNSSGSDDVDSNNASSSDSNG